jgi:hypothetical protein
MGVGVGLMDEGQEFGVWENRWAFCFSVVNRHLRLLSCWVNTSRWRKIWRSISIPGVEGILHYLTTGESFWYFPWHFIFAIVGISFGRLRFSGSCAPDLSLCLVSIIASSFDLAEEQNLFRSSFQILVSQSALKYIVPNHQSLKFTKQSFNTYFLFFGNHMTRNYNMVW